MLRETAIWMNGSYTANCEHSVRAEVFCVCFHPNLTGRVLAAANEPAWTGRWWVEM
jgi:hypothetical protein